MYNELNEPTILDQDTLEYSEYSVIFNVCIKGLVKILL